MAPAEMLSGVDLLPHSIRSHVVHRRDAGTWRISMTTRDDLAIALAGRYASSNRNELRRILDRFSDLSGLPFKHVAWMPGCVRRRRREVPSYPDQRLLSA